MKLKLILTKKCTKLHKPCVNCPYPKNEIPISVFFKDGIELASCFYCREYYGNAKNRFREKNKKLANEAKQAIMENKSDVGYCPYEMHVSAVNSIYPRNQVPKNLFLKNQNDLNSGLLDTCLDCRNYEINQNRIKSFESQNRGFFRCSKCGVEITNDKRALNLDGSLSKTCQRCKDYLNENSRYIRNCYRQIKLELIEKQQASCNLCKCIFFQPNGNLIVNKLKTYMKDDGNRYVLYGDIEYPVIEIIRTYRQILEIDIIDLDHIPEDELRNRGWLAPEEKYDPKRIRVSILQSETSMRNESKYCQPLCVECHIKETIRREKGISHKLSRLGLEKSSYVNKLKECGCQSCGIKPGDLPRFIHMDHLDPKTKKNDISMMIRDDMYSLKDLIDECSKCRPLCAHCHRIHTRNQINQGIFLPEIIDE